MQGPEPELLPTTESVETVNCQESVSGGVGLNTIMSPMAGRSASNRRASHVVMAPMETISAAAVSAGTQTGHATWSGSRESGSGRNIMALFAAMHH